MLPCEEANSAPRLVQRRSQLGTGPFLAGPSGLPRRWSNTRAGQHQIRTSFRGEAESLRAAHRLAHRPGLALAETWVRFRLGEEADYGGRQWLRPEVRALFAGSKYFYPLPPYAIRAWPFRSCPRKREGLYRSAYFLTKGTFRKEISLITGSLNWELPDRWRREWNI
jgi:hypothetical protein